MIEYPSFIYLIHFWPAFTKATSPDDAVAAKKKFGANNRRKSNISIAISDADELSEDDGDRSIARSDIADDDDGNHYSR